MNLQPIRPIVDSFVLLHHSSLVECFLFLARLRLRFVLHILYIERDRQRHTQIDGGGKKNVSLRFSKEIRGAREIQMDRFILHVQ